MQLNEIKTLVDSVVELYRDKKGGYKPSTELPEYHHTYKLSVEMMEAIRVHAVKGVFPDKLIAKRSPNQTDAEFNYVKENYKQVTLPVFVDLISTIQRAFNDNNWSLEFPPDEADDSLQNYLNEGLKDTPLQMPLEAWIKSMIPPIKEVDAMGCIGVKPWFIPTTENEDSEVVISGDRFEPVPYYYSSDQVVGYQDNEFFLFELKEKSIVTIGDRKVKEGLIYELYDKNAVWLIRQVGAKKDYTFEYVPYFVHELNKLPVSRLKGIPFYHDGVQMWASPFINVVDILDDAVLDACNLRGIKATCVYPYRVMTGTMCDATMEINGAIECCNSGHFNDLSNGRQITCSQCGGTGLKDRISPYGVMLLRPGSITDEGELKATQPAMYYVSPSIDTPEFLRTEIEKHLSQARAILHLRTTNSEVQPAEDSSATGRQLDEKALYSFIKNISDQIFELYEFTIDMIGMMRYGDDYQKPTLVYPVNFDLKGEAEYLEEIGQAVEKGVPQVAVHALTMKYLQSLFYNSGDTAKAFEIIVEADRLFTMSDDDILLKQGRGIIAPWEVILHDSAVTFIRELIQEDPGYLDKDLDEKISRLVAKAQAKATEVKPTQTATSVVDRILNANTPGVNRPEGQQA